MKCSAALENKRRSFFYESKLLEIAKGTGDKQREVRAYENIGHAYFVVNCHHKSIEFENEALRVSGQLFTSLEKLETDGGNMFIFSP